jgi:ribonuclease P protein subunit POP4
MRTSENLVRHELIGLKVRIVESTNKKNKGIEGRVVYETRNMLIIEKKNGKEIKVAKNENIFSFNLDGIWVRVDGKLLLGRPEDRIKKKFRRW